jgi:hypothetical protein
LFATVCAVLSAGCGGSKLGTVPVSGTLTIDGQPADNIEITLAPVDTAMPVATGLVKGGSFELFTGVQGESGAVPGKYKVVLAVRAATSQEEAKAKYAAAAKASNSGKGSPTPDQGTGELPFASKYTSSATSDKEIEIPKGGGKVEIDVSSK